MPKTILVTGAGGFIGRHVVGWLLNHTDHKVVAVTRQHPWTLDARLTFITPQQPIPPITHILNLASLAQPEACMADPLGSTRANLSMTHNLLEWARENPIEGFVHLSSGEVYGPTEKPVDEDTPHSPHSLYGAQKSAQEMLCLGYRATYGLPITIATTANVFGEHQPHHKFIPTIVRNLLSDQPTSVVVNEQGHAGVRRYIHADRLANGLNYLLDMPHIKRVHLGGVQSIDHESLVYLVADCLETSPLTKRLSDTSARKGHEGNYLLDCGYIRSLGWPEPDTFVQDLYRLINHYQETQPWNKP